MGLILIISSKNIIKIFSVYVYGYYKNIKMTERIIWYIDINNSLDRGKKIILGYFY